MKKSRRQMKAVSLTSFGASAFSLVEISLVVLIISVVMAGILKTNSLIQKSRLQSAQALTRKSPVIDISSLVVWYETSLPDSFIVAEAVDGTAISTWYDNNPNAVIKNNATQAVVANQPLFYENVFNYGIPAIRFDGSNDYLTFDGAALINTSYTIFVVEQRRNDSSNNYFMGGTSTSANANLILGYLSNSELRQSHYTDQLVYGSIPSYVSPVARIHSFVFNNLGGTSASGKRYWLNGSGASSSTNTSDDAQINPVTSYAGSGIGRAFSHYFNGDIAEIIIFSRNLTAQERWAIESYLSKKYSIKVAQ